MTTKAQPNSRVAVLGASANDERFSFLAVQALKEHGHRPIPIHPSGHVVGDTTALKSLLDITEPVDTITVYVNAAISSSELSKMLKLAPRRVVFNPGSENADVAGRLRDAGIEVVEACTLIMLRTQVF